MDALSEALNAVRITGAIFFHAECAAPWGFAVPPVAKVQHVLSPGTERLVNYNLVTEGRAVSRFSDGSNQMTLRPGDLTILPRRCPHGVERRAAQVHRRGRGPFRRPSGEQPHDALR
jgi:hypothetical protein